MHMFWSASLNQPDDLTASLLTVQRCPPWLTVKSHFGFSDSLSLSPKILATTHRQPCLSHAEGRLLPVVVIPLVFVVTMLTSLVTGVRRGHSAKPEETKRNISRLRNRGLVYGLSDVERTEIERSFGRGVASRKWQIREGKCFYSRRKVKNERSILKVLV